MEDKQHATTPLLQRNESASTPDHTRVRARPSNSDVLCSSPPPSAFSDPENPETVRQIRAQKKHGRAVDSEHCSKAEFWIDGMTCTMCSNAIESAIQKEFGEKIVSVAVNLSTDSATVEWTNESSAAAEDKVTVDTIRDCIECIGYGVDRVEERVDQPSNSNNTSSGNNDSSDPTNSVEERWQRLQQRQAEKLESRRRAFLWSLAGTVPILLLTMVIPGSWIPWMHHTVKLPWFDGKSIQVQFEALILFLLATPVQFITGWEFYHATYFNIFYTQKAGMDVLITLGTTASYVYAILGSLRPDHPDSGPAMHFFETSAVLICFVLLGKWLQALAVRRTSLALSQLMQLQAKTAIKVIPITKQTEGDTASLFDGFHPLRDPFREEILPMSQIQRGDWVKVVKGASVPADGRIVFGEVSVDESMITGESLPTFKGPGSTVLGGTICVESSSQSGLLVEGDPENEIGAAFVEVTGVGSETALARIVQLVSDAQSAVVPIQSFADTVSSIFVPAVCTVSLVTFLVWYALCSTGVVPSSWYQDADGPMTFSLLFSIACLVISCPCALGLATPTAVMVGTGVSANIGILLKGGEAMETASKIDSIIFDKTGTLTLVRVVDPFTAFSMDVSWLTLFAVHRESLSSQILFL